jgi:branched-chain amino acid transport system ATP-binding protein
MAETLLAVRDLTKHFGGLVATDQVALDIAEGEIHAIIGPNGAGKTTLVAQIAGELRPDGGSIAFAGREMTHLPAHARARRGLARTFQITSIFRDFTLLDNVALAAQSRAGHSFRFLKPARREASLRDPARALLEEIGLGARADHLAANLAHGEKRTLEIALALAGQPRLLLLDEPMAGMGPEDSARLIQLLASLKGRLTILLVEHDMDAVFALADRISVLVSGRILATGAPQAIRANAAVREAYLGEDSLA